MAKKRGRPRKVTDGVVENIELSELEDTTQSKDDEIIEVETDEENATHTTDYPVKNDDSSIVGKGTQNDYNPFAQSVVERDYSTPKVASGVIEEIEEPTFIPPSYEDIVNENRSSEKLTDNPFDNPNPQYNELDDKDKTLASESLVDTVLDGYEQLHKIAQQFVKVDYDELLQKERQGKLDLSATIPVDERGTRMTVGEFFAQYNKQSEEALTYDKEFGYKVRPAMIRVFSKKGWGMTDEQLLLIMFGKDVAVKVFAIVGLKKTLNSTVQAFEQQYKKDKQQAYNNTFTTPDIPSDNPVEDFEKEMGTTEPEIVEELTPEEEPISEPKFTSSLDINMPKSAKDSKSRKHPKEIRKEIEKGNAKK